MVTSTVPPALPKFTPVLIGGVKHNGIGPIVLPHEGKWEQEVCFTPVNVGEKQKVEFVLYKDGEPYRRLNLWVDVKELE